MGATVRPEGPRGRVFRLLRPRLDIYPKQIRVHAAGDHEARDRLVACFRDLRTFIASTAAAGQAVVVRVS